MSQALVIIGLQFGDEGKGKMVDYLGNFFNCTIRYNGGNNAGHTIVYNGTTLALSQFPSSAFGGKKALIAQGCVITPKVLLDEIKKIRELGIKINLGIDRRCHVVFPYHSLLDQASEISKGSHAIGSLKLGIGYCYEDKTNREGIRIEDLLDQDILRDKLTRIWDSKLQRIAQISDQVKIDLDLEQTISEYLEYGKQLQPYVMEVAEYVVDNIGKETFLLESAQSFYLDYAMGTYPNTVAYHTTSGSMYSHVGIPFIPIHVLGVFRSYMIRVGNGSFPTEAKDAIGDKLREIGKEYGTVSKRPRRCGWLDLPLLRYAIKMNGVHELAITKLDVLSHFPVIPVCIKYRVNGEITNICNVKDITKAEPIYEYIDGWNTDITTITTFDDLPDQCKLYLKFIEDNVRIPIRYISVGPDRDQTILK